MANISIKDVAKEAGVSVSSVSFYMNRPERLSKHSIERIKAACEKLQYAPGKNRRGPKLGRRSRFKTRNICFYCMAPMNMEELLRYPVVPQLLGCMQHELHKHHCRLLISGTGDNGQIPVTLSKKNCDGVILYGKSVNLDFYKNFKDKVADLPVIWTGTTCNDDQNEFDHVFYNNRKTAEIAVKYAANKNCKNIAVFNSHPEHPDYAERINFFEEAAKKYDINVFKFEPSAEDCAKSPADLNRKLVDVFEQADIPNIDIAYFCSDNMLTKFVNEMRNRNHEINFELFGCNNDSASLDYLAARPATIDIGIPEFAKQTIKRLMHRIDNYRKPMATTEVFIDPKLVNAENR